jgi:hypothetical protein
MNARLIKILCIVALMAGSPISLVSAAEGDCKADLQRLCPDIDPAGTGAQACLKENISDLSTGCKENIQKLMSALQSFGEACGQDVQTLCSEVNPGGGRILKCLKENKASVSAGCIGFLTK